MGRGPHRARLEKIRKAVELRLLGKTQNEIAEEMHCCRKTIFNYLKAASDNPSLFFPQETAWLRGHLWKEMNKLLNSGKLTPGQKARAIVDLLRSLEPVTARIRTEGEEKLKVIVRPWGEKDDNNNPK